MDMNEFIAARHARQRYWTQRFLELDSVQSELLARSQEALRKSYDALGDASQSAVRRRLCGDRQRRTLSDRGLIK